MHFRELLILALGLALGANGLSQGTNSEAGGAALAADNRASDKANVGAAKREQDADQGYVGYGAYASKREQDADQGYVGYGAYASKRDDADQGYVGID